jgi:hypothetical protein
MTPLFTGRLQFTGKKNGFAPVKPPLSVSGFPSVEKPAYFVASY